MLFKHRKKYYKKKLKNCLIHTINIQENSHHSFMCIFGFQTFFFYSHKMLYHSALNVQEIGKKIIIPRIKWLSLRKNVSIKLGYFFLYFVILYMYKLNETKKTKIDLSWQFSSISMLHIVIIISIIKYIIAFIFFFKYTYFVDTNKIMMIK